MSESRIRSRHSFTLCPIGDLIDLGLGASPPGAKHRHSQRLQRYFIAGLTLGAEKG